MKKLLMLFVLLFSSFVFADDISDFKIEGMSVGDSALNFFTKKHIEDNTFDYPNKKFMIVQNDGPLFFKKYDAVDFHYKTDDPNYIIQNISGIIFYNNFDECNNKLDIIVEELSEVFNLNKSKKFFEKFSGDKSGKSKFSEVYFELKSGFAVVQCYDFDEDYNSPDFLTVALDNFEINSWLSNEAWK